MSYQGAQGFNSFGIGLKPTPMVKRLLIANVVVFAVTLVVPRAFMHDWFAFQPQRIIYRPWGPFTYMFLHGDLMHLVGNMLFLFFFGPPIEGRWGEKEFLKFYVICGLGGVALSVLFMPSSIIGRSHLVRSWSSNNTTSPALSTRASQRECVNRHIASRPMLSASSVVRSTRRRASRMASSQSS